MEIYMRFKALVTKRLPSIVKSLSTLERTVLALVLVVGLSGIYWHHHTSQINLQSTADSGSSSLTAGVAHPSSLSLYTTGANTVAQTSAGQSGSVAQTEEGRAASAPASCTTTWTPYQTTYENTPYLPKGQTSTTPGVRGLRIACPGKPDINSVSYTHLTLPTIYSV